MSDAAQALSASMENYLETILLLLRQHAVARSKDISRCMRVTRSSVTGALQALSERGLVHYEPYGFVTLTREGTDIARKVRRRHEALRDLFVHVLGVAPAEADEAACRMEHGISKPIVDRLVEFVEFTQNCPRAGGQWMRCFSRRGADAPADREYCERCIAGISTGLDRVPAQGAQSAMSLTLKDLKPGEKGRIEKMSGTGAVKRRIRDMGMTTGSLVEVVRVAPLGDPIDVKVKGYHLSLRREEAATIAVKKTEGDRTA